MEYYINTDGPKGCFVMQELKLPATHTLPSEVEKYERFGKRIHWVDGNNMPGAFQMNTSWWFKRNREQVLADPNNPWHTAHVHDTNEIIAFYGSDPYNQYDLGGEIEFTIDGEHHILTKSTMLFIPAGMPHCPMYINRVDRPIFHYSVVMNSEYGFSREGGEQFLAK